MSVRVYELAKKLGTNSKVITDILVELGVEGKAHSSTISDEIGQKVEERFKAPPPSPPPPTAPPPPLAPAVAPQQPKVPVRAPQEASPESPARRPTGATPRPGGGPTQSTSGQAGRQAPPGERTPQGANRRPPSRGPGGQERQPGKLTESLIPVADIQAQEGKSAKKSGKKAKAKPAETEEAKEGAPRPEKTTKKTGKEAGRFKQVASIQRVDLGDEAVLEELGAADVIKLEIQRSKRVKRETEAKVKPATPVINKVIATPTPALPAAKRPKTRDRIRRDKRERFERAQEEERIETEKSLKTLRITELTCVGDIAEQLGVSLNELIGKLMGMGLMVTKNQRLDKDITHIIAQEYEFDIEEVGIIEEGLFDVYADCSEGELLHRPPVVTVMGHVDHGKTKLLDAIRQTNVVAGESGGITQHIGAYHVTLPAGQVVFLDTPGHETFTAMRAHGAMVTDIVILVVAASEGVMPQTIEAIHHARAAEVPIVVAVNKVDLPDANPDRVKQQLADHALLSDEWGGKTPYVSISALKKTGIEALLDSVLLEAEILDLKATPSRRATGTVIESRVDRGRGSVATLLVQDGTLRVGDPFVCGVYPGRVRALLDDQGVEVAEAGPSMPVEVLGLGGNPTAGDHFLVVEDERIAKQIAVKLQAAQREKEMMKVKPTTTLDNLYSRVLEGKLKRLCLIVKGDVQGSVTALCDGLEKLSSEKVKLQVIHNGVGPVGVADVMLASASEALIVGFNVDLNPKVAEAAERENVEVRLYRVIYDVINEIRAQMLGLLDKEFSEEVIGTLEVKQVFKTGRDTAIIGGRITNGKMLRQSLIRVVRAGAVVFTGVLNGLKRFKEDVREVSTGFECGLSVDGLRDVQEGDEVQCIERRELEATL